MANNHKCFGIELETTAGETLCRAYIGCGESDEAMQADATARMLEKHPGAAVKSIRETRNIGIS